jgi:5-(carboxyamino)imidazole ribonucleotide mutase
MKAKVAIIMGSDSDWRVMESAALVCKDFSVPFHVEVVSAHRTPDKMKKFCEQAEKSGIKVIIAGAGGAAHLPGMIASLTHLPVIGVPVKLRHLNGLDSILSIAQMPKGVPVATMAIDNAHNAGLLAIRILGLGSAKLSQQLKQHRKDLVSKVKKMNENLKILLQPED